MILEQLKSIFLGTTRSRNYINILKSLSTSYCNHTTPHLHWRSISPCRIKTKYSMKKQSRNYGMTWRLKWKPALERVKGISGGPKMLWLHKQKYRYPVSSAPYSVELHKNRLKVDFSYWFWFQSWQTPIRTSFRERTALSGVEYKS